MKTGLTSVTFRDKNVDEIIKLVQLAELDGIEWGGDVHVPAGDLETAKIVKEKCDDAEIEILSYGSYYKAFPDQNFDEVLATAQILKAPIIRIWAGRGNPMEITDVDYAKLLETVKMAVKKASEKGIKIALEYHRNTMTETKEGAERILKDVDSDMFLTYWQPNPDVSFEEHLAEIDLLKSKICTYHVFAWEKDNVRFLMEEHRAKWEVYISKIKDINLIMEFVKDNSVENFLADAKVIKSMIK